ncbi:Asp-tRNA(Asn)/Glu-tRNA(Gln) amidotransferase subunit GatC [Nanoarchaeota archaeon]
MEITKEFIKDVAKNARLELTEEEIISFTTELKEILDAFSKIAEVETADAKVSCQPVEMRDALRDDMPGKCLTQEEALSNSEHKQDGYFKGPKIV